ncbi:MAG: ABC transporter permease [Oscillospiraceae bacterium]|jgi:ABC-type transport system involved in multi-copper enzyme maturation permease subunit|nr:ABC transporter permease [Oscillospiraceae bacterium]
MDILANEVRRSIKTALIIMLAATAWLCLTMLPFPALATETGWREIGGFFQEQNKTLLEIAHLSDFVKAPAANLYFSVIFQPISLMFCVFFCWLGFSSISHEEKSGTIRYLYAMPVSRIQIALQKILAGFVQILICFTFTLALSFGLCLYLMRENYAIYEVLYTSYIILLGAFLSSATYLCVGFALSLFRIRRTRLATFFTVLISLACGFVGKYVLDSPYLQLLSPYNYAEAPDVLFGGIGLLYFVVAPGLVIGCSAVTIWVFQNRDLIKKAV